MGVDPAGAARLPLCSTRTMDLRGTGFSADARVVVQQHDDEQWIVWEGFTYTGARETFVVPRGMCTDFASVPRPFAWYLPRYGPYTLAAILHDHLWRDLAASGQLRYVDADAIFRRAMRQLDVPLFHRWVMWAAVRWAALVKPGGREGWSEEAGRVVLVTLAALPFLITPVMAIVTAMVKLFVLEVVLWVPLRIRAGWSRSRGRTPEKHVVTPRLELRLPGTTLEGCPELGWDRPLRTEPQPPPEPLRRGRG